MQPTDLSELKKRRKQNLKEFYAQIVGYTNDLVKITNLKDLNRRELELVLTNIRTIEEMRRVFYSEIHIKKNKRKFAFNASLIQKHPSIKN